MTWKLLPPGKGLSPAVRIYALFAVLVLLALATRKPMTWGDDAMYLQAMREHTLAGYLYDRYRIWSGRTLIDGATLVLLQHVWVWRVLTMAMLLVVFRFAVRFARAQDRPQVIVFACTCLALLPRDVMADSVWWMTGSMNYLWPLAAGLLALLPFLQPQARTAWLALCVPAALFAGSQEQAGLLTLGFMAVLALRMLHTGGLRWRHALLGAATLTTFLGLMLAPGTRKRYEIVTYYWFPEYADWTLDERVLAGLDLAFSHLFHNRNVLACVFVVLVATLVFLRTPSRMARALALVPVAVQFVPRVLEPLLQKMAGADHFLLRVWSYQTRPSGSGYVAHGLGNYGTALDPAFYVHFFVVACGALSLGASLYQAGLQSRFGGRLAAPLVFAAAIASGAMIGMSPTLYESGARVFHFQDMLMLMLATLAFAELPSAPARRRWLGVALLLAAAMAWVIGRELLKR